MEAKIFKIDKGYAVGKGNKVVVKGSNGLHLTKYQADKIRKIMNDPDEGRFDGMSQQEIDKYIEEIMPL